MRRQDALAADPVPVPPRAIVDHRIQQAAMDDPSPYREAYLALAEQLSKLAVELDDLFVAIAPALRSAESGGEPDYPAVAGGSVVVHDLNGLTELAHQLIYRVAGVRERVEL